MTDVKIPNSLVSVQFLAENLSAENLIILDASMKPVTPVANTDFASTRYIPNSLRFDFDNAIRDHNTSLPHMMPSPEFFKDEMQKMGINKNSAIVVYDNVGIYASPRAWWMFRAMGHDQIAVLDGGLPAWITAGYETVTHLKEKLEKRGDFISQPRNEMFVNSNIVLNSLNDSNFIVMDARSEGRFKGLEPEPREGLRGGHMPNAINIPFSSVLENGMLKPKPGLQPIFNAYKNRKMIFICGSGVTACILALAAEQAGYQNLSVYDGSWSEWGLASSKLPVTMD